LNRFRNADATADNVTGTAVYGGYSSLGNTTTNNKIKITNTDNTNLTVYGGYTAGAGDSTNNHVTITASGKVKAAYGGYATAADSKAEGNSVTVESGASINDSIYGGWAEKTANNNTVTIAGGTFQKDIYGGYATAANGTTENNIVNLGDDTHHDLSGATLSASDIYGGNKAATGNTLNVNAKNIAAKSVGNFENYKFKLNSATAFGDTMLSVTDAGDFSGAGVDFDKITVDRAGLSDLSQTHGIQRLTLLKRNGTLKFNNYAARELGSATETHEFGLTTDTGTGTANALLMEASRFKGSNVTYDGTTPTFGGEVYGGLSRFGHTTTGNTLTVTGLPASGTQCSYAYGGKNEGAAGDVKDNTATLDLPNNNTAIKDIYGGKITNAANAGEVSGNIVNMKQGKVEYAVGGQTDGTGAAKNNTVNLTGGTVQNVYGGYTNGTGKTTGNIVNIGYTDKNGVFRAVADGTKVTGTIYGGSKSDDVTGNTLNVRGAITAGQIANFEQLNFAVNKDTAGKTLLSLNGAAQTTGLDWSKVTATVDPTNMTVSSYGATRVTLMANANGIDFGTTYHGAKGETRDVFEFVTDKNNNSVYTDTYRFKGNEVSYAASDNTNDSAWSGRSELGNVVEENTLTMTGGKITDTAYGGTSRTNAAKKNTLVLRDGSAGELVGGFGTTATENTVDIFGGTVRGDVYGGRATNGAASGNTVNLFGAVNIGGVIHGGAGNTDSTNNTLAVRSFGTTAKDFDGVQNLHFYLPAGTTSSETRTMLTLTNAPAVKDISTLNLGVAAVAADARAFRRGDAVSLLKVNGTLTTATELKNTGDARTMKATQSGILDYTMRLEKRGENELIATVDRVDVNDRSKSPVETRVAASALLNAGADLLSNVGYTAAAEAAAVISAGTASAPSSAEGVRNTDAGLAAAGTAASAGANASAAVSGAFRPWAAQGGSSVRLNSGSYVDAKGWNLNVGFARTNEMKAAKLTYGPFVEYGRGTYDSYLDDGTHGSGAMHYIGGGVMAKMAQDSGLYVEGSLRAGRVSSDYTGSDDAAELSYDNASTYFAGHVGVGQEWKIANGNKIEGYAKYFYSHQAGDTVKLRSGGILEFGDVDAHRLRVGARYTHAVGGGGELYAGLAYEHEFGGDATATYQGYSTPSPSLGGGTGILELGYRFAPKDGRVSYGVNLMGMTGQREGIAGGAQITWAF